MAAAGEEWGVLFREREQRSAIEQVKAMNVATGLHPADALIGVPHPAPQQTEPWAHQLPRLFCFMAMKFISLYGQYMCVIDLI